MASRRNDAWEENHEVYTPSQVEGVLGFCGIEVVSDTNTHFLCYCTFHGNNDTPAFAVDKSTGLYYCFNPSCEVSGTLIELVRRTTDLSYYKALRTIIKYASVNDTPFTDRLAEAMTKEPDFVEFDQRLLNRLRAGFAGSAGEDYMHSRGFEDETLDFFEIGYSQKKNMVVVPMHDPKGMPIGMIGRIASHDDKRFKNSKHLPKSKTAWNIHRAKKHGDTVIVCEASFDAMRVHQAGYPNVVALLGGHVTNYHLAQLGRHFSKVIIMTDFDKKIYRPNCRMCNYETCKGHRPGRDLGRAIVNGLPTKKMMWAAYDDTCVYPHGAKDAGGMTDEEIRHCLRNAISNFAYEQWNIEEEVVAV